METEESVSRDEPQKDEPKDDEVMIIGEKTIPNPKPSLVSGRANSGQQETKSKVQKTFVQTLNEMFPGQTSYVEEGSTGPPHNPLFRVGVHVRGLTFHGNSRTKQKARHEAARAALQYLTGRQPSDGPSHHYHPHPYAMRHNNRYDNYHRYQPYYRIEEPPPPWVRPPPFLRPSFDPYYGSPYDTPYDNFYEPPYDDPYADPFVDHWRGEPHHLYHRERPIGPNGPQSMVPPKDKPPIPQPSVSASNPESSANSNRSVERITKKTNDFTSDDYNDETFVEFDQKGDKDDELYEEMRADVPTFNPKKERIILRVLSQSESGVNQNPVQLIHELQPNAKWVTTEVKNNKNSQTTFQMTLVLDMANEVFTGVARTKKLAKSEAASKALFKLYNISINPQNSMNPDLYKPKSTVLVAEEPLILKQDIANRIGAAVMAKCTEVWDQLTDLKKWTVLSSIVLTDETNIDFIDVICLTSGTKCVKGDSLSMNGYALNDCHAEVLARRSFLSYIYRQIERLVDNNFEDKPEFMVERRPDGFGFRVKPNIKVNLFISTAPCGDSRVFSPKEEAEGDAHPNRQTRGVLRAKIEGGEGTIPVKRDAILTWDGILQGHQRLQFMSCSDKIAVWNVIGLQGALLSHLMEPIYLESVVLASLFNYEHLVRAIHGRLNLNFDSNSLKSLPHRYALHKSKVAKCQLKEDITRQLTKAPNYALNWIKGDQTPEMVSTESGRIHIENTISRLAKRSFFARFCALLGRNTPVLPECGLGSNIPLVYRDGKTSSVDYQNAKTHCMQAFQEQNLGNWIQVPSEIDLFRL